MKKAFLMALVLLLSSILVVPSLRAEDTTTTLATTTTTLESTTTTISNATTSLNENTNEVTKPLSLWGRFWARLRIMLTRDPVEKAELSLNLTQDDLLRLEKTAPNNNAALQKALENYNKAITELKTRLENLKNISNNPNIDKLLNKLTNLEIRHQEVFDRLINGTSTSPFLNQVKNQFNQSIIPLHLRFENQDNFMKRLEEGLKNMGATSTPVGEFRQLRIMKALREQLQQMNINNLATSTQEQVNRLRERLENQIQQRTNTLEKQGFSSSTIENVLKNMPQPNKVINPQTSTPSTSHTPSTFRQQIPSAIRPHVPSTIRRGK